VKRPGTPAIYHLVQPYKAKPDPRKTTIKEANT